VSMYHFRTSPIDTMPARRSFSSTGIWRNLPFVMRSITLLIESFTSQVETLRVITCATGRCRTATPLSAIVRTMSRSDRMPARRPPTPRTTSAPIRCFVSNLAAAAKSAVKSMLPTPPPFAARMVFTLMPGSVRDHVPPILWSFGAVCLSRQKYAVGSLAHVHFRFTPKSGHFGARSECPLGPKADIGLLFDYLISDLLETQ